jgi:hypothetical protein
MDKALTGAAGEHYIAFRLCEMGYTIGLTARGMRAVDLLATNPETGKSITVQTKTAIDACENLKSGDYWHWPISSSRAQPRKIFFYMFVDLKGGGQSEQPDVFIVPSLKLKSPLLREYHNYAGCAMYDRDKKKYLNRWDIIEVALGKSST